MLIAVRWPLDMMRAGMKLLEIIHKPCSSLAFVLILFAMLTWTDSSQAVLLWTDLGTTQVHETGLGADILGGGLHRDNSSTDTLYFKFHVDPLSDTSTEYYFAGFQLAAWSIVCKSVLTRCGLTRMPRSALLVRKWIMHRS
jgi:hypothetical protein